MRGGELRPMKGEPPFVQSLAVAVSGQVGTRPRRPRPGPSIARFFNERGVLFGGSSPHCQITRVGMVTMSVLERAKPSLRLGSARLLLQAGDRAARSQSTRWVIHRSRNMVHAEVVLGPRGRTAASPRRPPRRRSVARRLVPRRAPRARCAAPVAPDGSADDVRSTSAGTPLFALAGSRRVAHARP